MKISDDKKEVGGWWMWIVGLIMLSAVAFGVLNSFGLIGRTIVERKVFEQSQQYSEARKTEILTFKAQLVEIEHKLASTGLDPEMRTNLEASAAGIRIQLSVARGK